MKLRPLTGTLTALVTPFKNHEVAYRDLEKLVEHQIKGGINGLVPVGTTGESPTVSHEEHLDVIRAVIGTVAGRVPVIAGTGSNSTHEAVELTQAAHAAGADGMLVVTPYYNKPSQEGLFRHYCAVADATDKPIILYSVPSRCGIEISVPVVERLRAKYRHVRWIKEAGGSVDRVDQLKTALGSDITVLCGDDSLTLPFASVGGVGVISVASHWAGPVFGQMLAAHREGDVTLAAELNRSLLESYRFESSEEYPNPVPAKAACRALGLTVGQCRLPNAPTPRSLDDQARSVIAGVTQGVQTRQSLA